MVKQIFSLCLAGNGPTKIARMLTEQNIPTPGTMEYRCAGSTRRYYPDYLCKWSSNTVEHILDRREYLGHTVNSKTEKVSYKVKTSVLNPEDKVMVFEHTHEAIIVEATRERAQDLRKQRKRPNRYGEVACSLACCSAPTAAASCTSRGMKQTSSGRTATSAAAIRNAPSTVMRVIKRGLTVQRDTNLVDREVYCTETEERKYQENLRAKGPDIKLENDHDLANYIEVKIADDGYSPEAAFHKIKEDDLTFSVTLSKWTVYKYINDGVFLRVTNKALPMGGKRKTEYKKVQAAKVPKGESIEKRPSVVEQREDPFH